MSDFKSAFTAAPLITPERLASEQPEILFSVAPTWVRLLHVMHDDPDEPRPSEATVLAAVGRKHTRVIQTRPDELSALCELTRFGGRVVTNSNFNKPVPQIYAKLLFHHAPDDLMSIRRVLFGAADGTATKALWSLDDYRAESTRTESDQHPKKDARAVSIRHATALARECEAAGRMPEGVNVVAYLANLDALFACIDARLGGEG